MIVIPIRTESVARRTPTTNIALIGLNVLAFLVFDERFGISALASLKEEYLYFQGHSPAILQFFTYQFMHADVMHLLGNMLFLWVFGNSVNGKMGDVPYLLFYLAGGVFAAWGYAIANPDVSLLLGASGAVAAITTAYLALFPRSHVTVFIWFFLFIHFVEVPAMLLIGLKIIVWDNMIAPNIGSGDRIAYSAHLAGYLFGFGGALLMLFVRGLPRDQFDLLAVWRRWHQRRTWQASLDPASAQFGTVARTTHSDPRKQAEEDSRFARIADLRAKIGDLVDARSVLEAAKVYEQLLQIAPTQCLPERQQLELARHFYASQQFRQAATSFERFIDCYPGSWDAPNVRLLLGIIYARDLRELEAADRHLSGSIGQLRDQARRDQCLEWLTNVRLALGRPAPDG